MKSKLPPIRLNVGSKTEMSLNIGFVVHPDKSTLEPTQVVTFVINIILMQVTLTANQAGKVEDCMNTFLP